MVTFVYFRFCYFYHEGTLSQIEFNLSGLRIKGRIMNLLFALSTKQHCTFYKGKIFYFFPFFCFSVELVCVSCSVTQNCFCFLKKASKQVISILFDTRRSVWGLCGCELSVNCSWISACCHLMLVFLQSSNVCLYLQILKSRSWWGLHCLAASFLSCLMSPFSLCCLTCAWTLIKH